MSIFKEEFETKRVIFNIRGDLANRLLWAKEEARTMGKRLDIDTPINKALEKFLEKAEKRIKEEKKKHGAFLPTMGGKAASGDAADSIESDVNGNDPYQVINKGESHEKT